MEPTEIKFEDRTFRFNDDDEMNDCKVSIAQVYYEKRGELQHSCEGTSEVQRFQFEEAIMLLDLKYYAALTKMECDTADLCDGYRTEEP
jgi:hypothetical protein